MDRNATDRFMAGPVLTSFGENDDPRALSYQRGRELQRLVLRSADDREKTLSDHDDRSLDSGRFAHCRYQVKKRPRVGSALKAFRTEPSNCWIS